VQVKSRLWSPGTGGASAFSGWTMLAIASLVLMLSAPSQTYGFSVFIDPMLEEFGWTRSLIATAYLVGTMASAGAVLIVGRLLDRVGHRAVMVGVSALYVVALALMGSVSSPWTLVAGFTLLRATGASALTLAARTLVSQWFVKRRGRAVSVVNLGKMAGVAISPLLSALLINEIGWRDAWRVNALITAPLVVLAALYVRGRPEDVGQYPDGARIETGETDRVGGAVDQRSWTLKQALHTRTLWLVLFATAVPATLTNGISFHQISILSESGLRSTQAALAFTIESAVAIPMTLAAGWLADRFGPRYLLAFGQATLAVTMVWLTTVESAGDVFIYGVLRGLTTGTWILAAEVSWPTYFGRRHLGSIVGLSFAVGFIGAAVGPLPFSLAYDRNGSYDAALWVLAVLPVAAMVGALLIRPPVHDRIPAG